MKRYVVIMAGGVGTRFWPASTEERPKQFLDILGIGKSLLRMTYERSLKIVDSTNIIVMTNKKYFALVKQEIPELLEENILCEPSRNDTAPCLAYAALVIKSREENSSFAVFSSDHVILKEDVFADLIKKALSFCETGESIVTLGIKPLNPNTGYGYIQFENNNEEVKKVISFKEKPNLDTAKLYVESGEYLWNAGIFIWKTNTLIESFKKYTTGIIDILNQEPFKFNTSSEQDYIDEVYPQTTKISIDYAIIEKASNRYVLSADIGWSDLGTWASLYDYSEKNNENNVIQSDGYVITNTDNCIIRVKDGKKVLINGLSNYIVVDEENALLIFPKNKEQEIKEAIKGF